MSFSCKVHGWSHLWNSCPACQRTTVSDSTIQEGKEDEADKAPIRGGVPTTDRGTAGPGGSVASSVLTSKVCEHSDTLNPAPEGKLPTCKLVTRQCGLFAADVRQLPGASPKRYRKSLDNLEY